MTDYVVYDVFTDTPLSGNPLAVVLGAQTLPDAALQKIAAEFNLSETAFVLPPEDPAHTARLRIFTPVMELPFAGHPTIGTAIALADLGAASPMVFELGVGPIPITLQGGEAAFTTRVPLTRGGTVEAGDVARSVGLEARDIQTAHHLPQLAGVGLDYVFAQVVDRAALARAKPDTGAMEAAQANCPPGTRFEVHLYAREGDKVFARMFAPLFGIPEDPATGSANAALTAYLAELDGQDLTLDITQGVEMGRPSTLRVSAVLENGVSRAVTVAGRAVKVMEGRLTLP
ncbi:MAG: PhzF family phenazine biosynthesis protein [Pseudomonadota bacterium]